MLDRKSVTAKVAELKQQLESMRANMNAVLGAIQFGEMLLADKPEGKPEVDPSLPAVG